MLAVSTNDVAGAGNAPGRWLVVKAKGGMGNRMLCAITGILYGQLTARTTVVDWSDVTYSDDGSNTFTRFFTSPSVAPDVVVPPEGRVHPAVWMGQMHKSMSQMLHEHDPDKHSSIRVHRKYSIDVRRTDYEEKILVFWYYKDRLRALRTPLRAAQHSYAGLSPKEIIRRALREELLLAEEVRQRIEAHKNKQWAETVIGMHIRHTDRRTDLEQYERSLQRFLKQAPRASIFLCTDNREVNERYRARYKNLFCIPKWFPTGGASMHQNEMCPDKVANAIQALLDMYLLAECDYLVYPGGSTFSRISRILSGLPADRVADIERFNAKVRLKRWIRELAA